jgi:hypothetical protein
MDYPCQKLSTMMDRILHVNLSISSELSGRRGGHKTSVTLQIYDVLPCVSRVFLTYSAHCPYFIFVMRWIQSVALATTLISYAASKEQVPNDAKAAELYDSGVMMERIMAQKEVGNIDPQDVRGHHI